MTALDALAREIRDIGLIDDLMPAAEAAHMAAIREAIDAAGRIDPAVAAPFRTPLTYDWGPSEATRKRVPRAGDLVLIGITATTPPTGTCEVSISMQTALGSSPLAKATLPIGVSLIDVPLDPKQPVPAGARLVASVTSAGGASGVSISAEIQVG